MEFGIGLLGTKFMGKAHSHAYRSMTTFMGIEIIPKLIAIYGRVPEYTSYVAKAYGYKRYYLDWRKLIRDPEVEVVDNSLPNFLHKDPSIEAIELGKHVICEKPLARNLEEALEMLRAARKSGIIHGLIFNKRNFPAIQLAKKYIEEGRLGKILHFRFAYHQDWATKNQRYTWRFNKEQAGYGVVGDQGSHVIDMIRYLIGEVDEVIATSTIDIKKRIDENGKERNVDVEDSISILMKLKNGAHGVIEASRYSRGMKNYFVFEIYGEEGSLYFNMERLNELWYYDATEKVEESGFKRILVSESEHPYYKHFWPAGHTIGWVESFIIHLYRYLKSIKEGREFKPNFYDGAVINAILDSIYKSIEERRWVKVPEIT